MPRPRFTIEPQRRQPRKGYVPCPHHAATRWTVLDRGLPFATCTTKAGAEAIRERAEASAALRPPSSTPGSRYGPLGIRGGRPGLPPILFSSKPSSKPSS